MAKPMPAIEAIRGFHDELTAIRRDLHANPELGLEEHRTAEIVAAKLAEWGIEVHRGVGKTGVVGVLKRGSGGKSIGLRADMDCLPMEEQTNLPYRSSKPGLMHACGHDGHTTMLLGAARYLAASPAFQGTVHFIFQPGEEGVGGALAMLAGRAVREISLRSGVRPAQPARPSGRHVRDRQGAAVGGRCVLRHHDHGPRRARRPPRAERRSGAGGRPHHHGPAVDRGAQCLAGRHGRAERDARRRRRCLQRHSGNAPRCRARRARSRPPPCSCWRTAYAASPRVWRRASAPRPRSISASSSRR